MLIIYEAKSVCLMHFSYCSYSYYLYSITHPNRKGIPLFDLSEDEAVKAKLGISVLTCKQLALERVIVKVFDVLRINGIITDRIRSIFAAKLHRMGSNLKVEVQENISYLKNGNTLFGL